MSSSQQYVAPRPAFIAPGLAKRPGMGHYLLLLYLFLLLGRIPEITADLIHTSLYQIFIVSVFLAINMLLTGTAMNAVHTKVGRNFLFLHGWLVLACLFSFWHTGSLDAMMYILRYLPMLFFMGAFIQDIDQLRRAAVAAALSIVAILIWALISPGEDAARLSVQGGRFSNANEIAIYFSVGGPFLVYVAASKHFNIFVRILATSAVIVCIYEMLRTGSRGGLITIVALAIVCFLAAGARIKLTIAVAAAGFAVAGALLIPTVTLSRFGTIFGAGLPSDVTGAVSSSQARRALLMQSLAITLQHPLLGVGPGVYAAAVADQAKALGEKTGWQVTHNAYTELSAESGIPGFAFFVLTLWSIVKSSYSMRRRCLRMPGHEDEALLAGCIILSAIAFCINGLFASIGTDFYLYMIGGFAIAVSRLNIKSAESSIDFAASVNPDREPVLPARAAEAVPQYGSALRRRLEQRKIRQSR